MSFADYIKTNGSFDQETFEKKQEFDELSKNDTVNARLEPGEIVLHPELFKDDPEFLVQIFSKMIEKGQNPFSTIAGSDVGNYDPMDPNSPQHFFFGKIFRAIKRVVKTVAKNPITRTLAVAAAAVYAPQLIPALSGPAGSAIAAGVTQAGLSKAAGASTTQALLSGLGTGAGSYIGGQLLGSAQPSGAFTGTAPAGSTAVNAAGNTVNVAGQTITGGNIAGYTNLAVPKTFGSMASGTFGTGFGSKVANLATGLPVIGPGIAGANIGSAIGSQLGGSLGGAAGMALDPPEFQYDSSLPLPKALNVNLPRASLNLGLNAGDNPNYIGSNLSASQPFPYVRPRETTPGVEYLRRFQVGGANPGTSFERVNSFGNALYKADRGFGLRGRGGFGVLYY